MCIYFSSIINGFEEINRIFFFRECGYTLELTEFIRKPFSGKINIKVQLE